MAEYIIKSGDTLSKIAQATGSSIIIASGGTGAGDNTNIGGNGRIHADHSSSITGTTSPTINTTLDRTLGDTFMGAMI